MAQPVFLIKTSAGSRPDPKLAPKTNLVCSVCCDIRRTPLAPGSWQMEEFPDEVYYRLMSRLEKRKFYFRDGEQVLTVGFKEYVHTYIRYDLLSRQVFFRITERLCPRCASHYDSREESNSYSSIVTEESSSSSDD